MDDLPPFPYGAMGPMAVGLRQCLGHCLMIRPPQHDHLKRITIKFARVFQLYDTKGKFLLVRGSSEGLHECCRW